MNFYDIVTHTRSKVNCYISGVDLPYADKWQIEVLLTQPETKRFVSALV